MLITFQPLWTVQRREVLSPEAHPCRRLVKAAVWTALCTTDGKQRGNFQRVDADHGHIYAWTIMRMRALSHFDEDRLAPGPPQVNIRVHVSVPGSSRVAVPEMELA